MVRAAMLVSLAACSALSTARQPIDGVTFASRPGTVYVPVREAAEALGWRFSFDEVTELATVNGKPVPVDFPALGDGTLLVPLDAIAGWGASVSSAAAGTSEVRSGSRTMLVKVGPKRVGVDMSRQVLRAWQGDRLVFESPVSTGRMGKETPNGSYRALARDEDHISSTYGSPMPWSVQVVGNIYIHGSESFYDGIGSHGCVRLPLTHGNRAKWFFDWCDLGTPIRIVGARPAKGNTRRA